MSNDEKKKNRPIGDAVAIIEAEDRRASATFVPLAAVWLTKSGQLAFTMHSTPLAWVAAPKEPRRVMIRLREHVQLAPTADSDANETGAPADDDTGGAF